MTTIDQIIAHPAVIQAKAWEMGSLKRTYLTLAGYDRSYSGDRNAKVYVDHKMGKLVIEMGKGICTTAFNASLAELKAAFPSA